MSAAELDAQMLANLQPMAQASELSVVLGAGASAAAGLPDWDTLAARLLVRSGAVADDTTARAFLARQDPALAAEAARAVAQDWDELVRAALYDGAYQAPEPAVLHLAVAGLAVQRALAPDAGTVRLFTQNFDLLLETAVREALAEAQVDRSVYSRATSRPAPRGHMQVDHLHGVVGPQPGTSESVVLTLSDFTRLTATVRPWQVAALQDALQHGPMLLAGTSYRDPDLRQWLHELTSTDLTAADRGADSAEAHQLTVLLARQGLGLDRQQFGRVQAALVEQWRAIRVQPVLVQDHSDAAQAVRELPFVQQEGYQPPAVRAAALWAAHVEDFTALQHQHSALLEDDLALLRPHLGREANLTLWLADGTGELVRWAAHDRTYRHPAQLRRVPTGYDSPWIAGQCLGRDDILARDLDTTASTDRWRSVSALTSWQGLEDTMAMRSTSKTSVQEVSPGTFRIAGVGSRSALTGRFMTPSTGERSSRSTVEESSGKADRRSSGK